jgi:hypothetical protein
MTRAAFGEEKGIGEILIVDDNNNHDGTGLRYAVLKKGETYWSVLEVDEGFKSEDRILQGLADTYFRNGSKSFVYIPDYQ